MGRGSGICGEEFCRRNDCRERGDTSDGIGELRSTQTSIEFVMMYSRTNDLTREANVVNA